MTALATSRLAWHVWIDGDFNHDEHHDDYVFAATEDEAHAKGQRKLDADDDGVMVAREPLLDGLIDKADINRTLVEKLRRVFECDQCYRGVSASGPDQDDDDDGNPLPEFNPVYRKNYVFCCPECDQGHAAERRAEEQRGIANQVAAQTRWPGIKVVALNTHVPDQRVEFTFPGGKLTATWCVNDDTVWVAWMDRGAWDAFVEAIAGVEHE